MPYLLRRAKKTAWSGAWPVTPEQRHIALETFAWRTEDTDGVSLFEVGSAGDEALVVAAVACDRRKDDAVDLLHLEREEIERFGLIAHTLGTLPVPRVNALHRSLDWPEETLAALVDMLLTARRAAVRGTRALMYVEQWQDSTPRASRRGPGESSCCECALRSKAARSGRDRAARKLTLWSLGN